MKAKIQKQLVASANHRQETLHLNDRSCVFDDEEGEFYVKVISPLTSCGTHYKARIKTNICNDNYVKNSNDERLINTG